VTEDYNREKENEWWIRQKYKLMRALKRKWEGSAEADLLKQDKEAKKVIGKPHLYK